MPPWNVVTRASGGNPLPPSFLFLAAAWLTSAHTVPGIPRSEMMNLPPSSPVRASEPQTVLGPVTTFKRNPMKGPPSGSRTCTDIIRSSDKQIDVASLSEGP